MDARSARSTAPRQIRWEGVRDELRRRGLRWTPQRRILIEVLSSTSGHVTGGELVARCRAIDPTTVPSTVYRTLDVLEDLGLVSHSHGHDGREEFHVLPESEHAHLHCTRCGRTWELPLSEAATFVAQLNASRGFAVQVSHLSVGGLCPDCRSAGSAVAGQSAPPAPLTRDAAVNPRPAAPRGR